MPTALFCPPLFAPIHTRLRSSLSLLMLLSMTLVLFLRIKENRQEQILWNETEMSHHALSLVS